MKTNLKYLFVVTASSLLLAGCCTAPHATQWEYQVRGIPVGKYRYQTQAEIQEAFLNDMSRNGGWIYFEKDANGDFFFKRPKK